MSNKELQVHKGDNNMEANYSDSDSDVVIVEKSVGEIIEVEDDDEACVQGAFVSPSDFLKKDSPYIKNPFCHLVNLKTWKELQNQFPDLASNALYCAAPSTNFIPRGIIVKRSVCMEKFRSKYPELQKKVQEEEKRQLNIRKRKRNDAVSDIHLRQYPYNGSYQQHYYGSNNNNNYGKMCSAFYGNNYYETFHFGYSPQFYQQDNFMFQESQRSRTWSNRSFSRYPLDNYHSYYRYQYDRRGSGRMRAGPSYRYTAANSRVPPYSNSLNIKRVVTNDVGKFNRNDKPSNPTSFSSSSKNCEINNNHFESSGSSECPDVSAECRRIESSEVLTDNTELPAKKRKLNNI